MVGGVRLGLGSTEIKIQRQVICVRNDSRKHLRRSGAVRQGGEGSSYRERESMMVVGSCHSS